MRVTTVLENKGPIHQKVKNENAIKEREWVDRLVTLFGFVVSKEF